jgi:hypothetical protein
VKQGQDLAEKQIVLGGHRLANLLKKMKLHGRLQTVEDLFLA